MLCKLEMEYNNITFIRYRYIGIMCKNTHGRDGCCNGNDKFKKKHVSCTQPRFLNFYFIFSNILLSASYHTEV